MQDVLLTEEQKKLRDEVRAFVRDDVPRQLIMDMDAERVHYPRQFLEAAARRRLLGLRFPEEYGGRGLGWAEEAVALAEVGVVGGSLSCLYSLVSIVGEALHVFGTPEQKDRWLRPALEGKLTVAEALTEPRGGSDFFGATTTARREGDVYVLNGQKRFIVGAEGADYFLVYARTNPDGRSHEALSAFIVEKGPGVEVQHVYGLLGTRGGGAGRVYFRDVCVPRENLIGREHGGAELFYQMMIPERMTSAAGALGGAQAALEIAARYSDRRKASLSSTPAGRWSTSPPAASTLATSRAAFAAWCQRPRSSSPRQSGRSSTTLCRSWVASVTPTSIPSSGCSATRDFP
jgi:acyl-CoA dehydrogenase